MRLRGRHEELDWKDLPQIDPEKLTPLDTAYSGSNTSEQTAILHDLEMHDADATPDDQAPLIPKKKGRRKRKSAEEKAANVRARNRRAQQAFRKRQKALSLEKNESMASLMEEVDELRETNMVLQRTVDKLMAQLEHQEMTMAEQMEQSPAMLLGPQNPQNQGNTVVLNPHHAGPKSVACMPGILDDACIPDLMNDHPIPDLLEDFDFVEPF